MAVKAVLGSIEDAVDFSPVALKCLRGTMSQQDFSRWAGIPQATWQRWESGHAKPSRPYRARIARIVADLYNRAIDRTPRA